jgi:hypothetical protein
MISFFFAFVFAPAPQTVKEKWTQASASTASQARHAVRISKAVSHDTRDTLNLQPDLDACLDLNIKE